MDRALASMGVGQRVGGVSAQIELGCILDCDHLTISCDNIRNTRGIVIGDSLELALQDWREYL